MALAAVAYLQHRALGAAHAAEEAARDTLVNLRADSTRYEKALDSLARVQKAAVDSSERVARAQVRAAERSLTAARRSADSLAARIDPALRDHLLSMKQGYEQAVAGLRRANAAKDTTIARLTRYYDARLAVTDSLRRVAEQKAALGWQVAGDYKRAAERIGRFSKVRTVLEVGAAGAAAALILTR